MSYVFTVLFLGAFTKLRKETIRFVMSIRLPVRSFIRLYGKIQLSLGGFSWNLIFEDFSTILREILSVIKI